MLTRHNLSRHIVSHVVTSFHRSYGLPGDLLKELYDYPSSSQFFHDPAPVSRRCRYVGMNPKTIYFVRCAECLIKDNELYCRNPEQARFQGHDIQLLFSTLTGQTLTWYLESEEAGTLPASEGVLVFCVIYLMAIIYKSTFPVIPGARKNLLSHVDRHLYDPECMTTLQAAGLDVWAALTVVTMAGRPYYDHFWSVWLEVLSRQVEQPMGSFDELKVALERGVWLPSAHNVYAHCIWDDTIWDTTSPDISAPTSRVARTYSIMPTKSTSVASPNPYINYLARSWSPITNTKSRS